MWLERAYGDDDDNGSSDKGKGKDDGPREKTPEPTIGTELLVSSFTWVDCLQTIISCFNRILLALSFLRLLCTQPCPK